MADGARWGAIEKGDLVAGKVTGKVAGNTGGMAAGEAQFPSWADRLLDHKSWDFGPVQRGKLAGHIFRVVNTLGLPIHLASVRSSAAFVKAFPISSLDEEGGTQRLQTPWIAPHQSINIEVLIDTQRFVGDKIANIYVQFDQPASAEVRLQVHASSLESPGVTPVNGESKASYERMKLLEHKAQQLTREIDALRDD